MKNPIKERRNDYDNNLDDYLSGFFFRPKIANHTQILAINAVALSQTGIANILDREENGVWV